MSDKITPKDTMDRTIKPGDICVYPVRHGAKMWVNTLNVQDITYNAKGEPKLVGYKQDGFTVRVSSLDRVTIVGRNNYIPFIDGEEE